MGILRVYLALCVVAAHSGAAVFPWRMHDSRQAVQIFYIISGFYMAMVLSTRYSSLRAFYVSRALRIFPPYWTTLLATLALSIVAGLLFHEWLLLDWYVNHPLAHNGAAGLWLAAVSNVTLVGQDWVMFVSHDAGWPLHFTTNFVQDATPLWHYLLVPQCWSVGVELTFYLLAPFLNRLRSRWLVLIALGAFAARLLVYRWLGSAHDPWTLRFFPFEISLFLLGMLGYRLYVLTASYHPPARFRCVSRRAYAVGAVVVLGLLYLHVRAVGTLTQSVGAEAATLLSYPLWGLLVPAMFFVFGKQHDDRLIGELSYPIYLVHYVIVLAVPFFLVHFGVRQGNGVVSALLSVAVAAVFYVVFIARLDRQRHALAKATA